MRIMDVSRVLLFASCWRMASQVPAQQTARTDQVLPSIEHSLKTYAALLPSIQCNERIVSEELHKSVIKKRVELTGLVSLSRPADNAEDEALQPKLQEHSTIYTVNDKAYVPGHVVKLPFLITNGFSSTMGQYFGEDKRACNRFEVLSPVGLQASPAIRIEVQPVSPASEFGCDKDQQAFKASFTFSSPAFQLIQGSVLKPNQPTPGAEMSISVDYGHVRFGEQDVVVPTQVHANVENLPNGRSLRYSATYTSCHRFTSTTTMRFDSLEQDQ